MNDRTDLPERGTTAALERALYAVRDLRARVEAAESARHEPIAIIGIGCRFPGKADDPVAFWRLLRDGVDTIREVPPDRWDLERYFDPDPEQPGKMYTRWGGFLETVDRFDARFFGISPREAISLDPQHRLLLEVGWEALEDAAQAPDRLRNTAAGVFVGIGTNDYARCLHAAASDPARSVTAYHGTGNSLSAAAGRLSHCLGLQGPSLALDTACSSSLVAVHLACQGLRNGECDLALAGGVNLILAPEPTIQFCKARMMAPDGRCKTFDARANGYVRSEGCGMVVLKRLAQAEADGDRILALIRGSAVNHDGPSSGLTVPNGPAQEALLRQALAAARVDPDSISYVEAHGTGTALGDPIEVEALGAVLASGRTPDRRLLIGSVKTNLGHLEPAAGIAGLIKVVLALGENELPPHLHLQRPNPFIPWDRFPIGVLTERTPWPAGVGPRRAGVSSFGFAGTNAHIIVEEAPPSAPVLSPARPPHLLCLSARTPAALKELAARWQRHLIEHPGDFLADLAHTAWVGRSHLVQRLAVLAETSAQAAERLAAWLEGQPAVGVFLGEAIATSAPPSEEPDAAPESRARDWVAGRTLKEVPVEGSQSRRKLAVPTYPFERQRYWVESQPGSSPARAWPGKGPGPLHGSRLRSPALRDIVFEKQLDAVSVPLLRQHRIQGQIVVAGMVELAMVLDAVHEVWRTESCCLEDVFFTQVLILAPDEPRTVQLVFTEEGESRLAFQVLSCPATDGDSLWVLHARGIVSRRENTLPEARLVPAEVQARCPEEIAGNTFYREIVGQADFELGEQFQWVERIWRREGEALGRMRPARPADAPEAHRIPPGLLDASFQVCMAAGQAVTRSVPVAIRRLVFDHRPEGPLWCHVIRNGAATSSVESAPGEVRLHDAEGNLAVRIEGIRSRPIALDAMGSVRPSATTGRMAAAVPDLRQPLRQAVGEQRRGLVLAHVMSEVIRVLNLPSDQPPSPRSRLFEIGLDSLMALELRDRLQQAVGQPLLSTLVFDHPTIDQLAEYLIQEVDHPDRANRSGPGEDAREPKAVAHLQGLSEEALAELLSKKLDLLEERRSR